jgi:hypothetical protein
VGELRVVDPCLSNVYERLSPPQYYQQIVICRIHFYLLNRTDQFTWLSGLIPSFTFNSPLSSPLSLPIPALPLPSLALAHHVLHLRLRSGNDQRLSYVQGLQA